MVFGSFMGMGRLNFGALLQDVFRKTLFNKTSIRQGITLGILTCVILNIGWAIFHIKALEQIQTLAKSKGSSSFIKALSTYLKDALTCLGFRYSYHITYSFFIEKLSRILMAQFLSESMQLSYVDFIKNDPGKTIATIQNKVAVYRSMIDISLFKCVSLSFFFISSLAKIYETVSNGVTSVVSLLTLSLYLVVYIYLDMVNLNKKLRPHAKYIKEKRKNSSRLFDKIHNFDILKSYGLEEKEGECFYQELGDQRRHLFAVKLIQERNDLLSSCFSEISFIVILCLMRHIHFLDQYNHVVSYMLVFRNLTSFLSEMSSFTSNLALSINELVIEDTLLPKTAHINVDITFKDTIEFKNVNLYHDDRPIIEGINMVIQKGESIAVVGHNGSGKSTFIKSLLGFTKYTGDILIDGVSIKSISNKSVLKLISYISQDDYTSDDTVLNNIKLGNTMATRATIESKAELFGANETFLKLENGYETMAGVKGSKLSAGQKQKISLVRAAIRDAPIFILDEATAAMDKGYERKVLYTILNRLPEKTVLMIIHDKSYLRNFDKICFFNKGALECVGNHGYLMETSLNFREFASLPVAKD